MELNDGVRIERLAFHFDTRPVFQELSVAFGNGITWLRGANGAGKTTLLKLLAGALAPDAGTIRQGGIDSARAPLAYRLRTYYCGGDTPDLPWLTAREWLDLYLALYPAADAALLDGELAAFGLRSALDQAITTLSLGQHKKLQLALALSLPVRLLLIDEPFNGLDAQAMDYLRGRLRERAAAATGCVILTSHLDPQVPLLGTLDLPTPA